MLSGVGAALVWLVEVIGKKKIGDLLTSGDARASRAVQRALIESQDKLDEMADMARGYAAALEQRDALHLENLKLRIENNTLRTELAALKPPPDVTPPPPSIPSATARRRS